MWQPIRVFIAAATSAPVGRAAAPSSIRSIPRQFTTPELYCVGAQNDIVWVGGSDGIASTIDNGSSAFGSSWNIYRTSAVIGTAHSTYAYPNPFSPDLEFIRIHFSTKYFSASSQNVDIRIFNFAMQPVRTLLRMLRAPAENSMNCGMEKTIAEEPLPTASISILFPAEDNRLSGERFW